MRTLLPLVLLFLASFGLNGQDYNFWSSTNESAIRAATEVDRNLNPSDYQTFQLNLEALKVHLQAAPMEFSTQARNSPLLVELPLPTGRMETFKVSNSPVMQPGLAARFPMIQSFTGRGGRDNEYSVRFLYSEKGFHAIFNTPDGLALVAPYSDDNTDYYISYYYRNIDVAERQFVCGIDHETHVADEGHILEEFEFNEEVQQQQNLAARQTASEVVELREYSMAMACTAEWANLHGGTVSGGLSAMNVALNLLNGVYEPEVAVRFVLIENNDILVFTDAATDPYNMVTNGGGLLGQNQNALDQLIGFNNYDVGHVMTIGCSGGLGGIAALASACGVSKGRGVTCQYSNLETVILNVTTHEVGHQFSASHSWDNCPGSEGQRAGTTAFEPGSGSTIMSYAGSCGDQNVVFNGDIYFHVGSLDQMYNFSRNLAGNDCPTITPTDNNTPDLAIPLEDGFYIPISTPFELTAIGSDPDGDPLTYCWEQYNTGPLSLLGMPTGSAPSFRSYPAVSSPTRVFPRMQSVVSNISQDVEVLPTYTRNLKFRCTARDNNSSYGGVVWEEVSFQTTDQAGPFRVTYPNNLNTWAVGDYQEVTWEVANTDQAPVNCQKVNIKLSTDGGYNYPITLAEGVPNDGAHFITVPNMLSNTARVRVEAAANIFFDISNTNFEIVPPTEPGFALSITPFDQQVCAPDAVEVGLDMLSLLDYDSLVTFTIEGLPNNADATFSANPALPSVGSTLSIATEDVTENGIFDLTITAIAQGGDTLIRETSFDLVINDFSALAPMEPADGSSGVVEVPDFTWTGSPYADSYDIEIATSPTFGNATVISATNLTEANYTPSILLEKSELYFWRIRANNACGSGEFSAINAFHTETFSCNNLMSTDVPLNISGQGLPVIESTLVVDVDGTISDINVSKLEGSHDLVSHLKVNLISPAGTDVLLFAGQCATITIFNMALDDEAPSEFDCPPTGGVALRPEGLLSDFDGENPLGTWTLRVEVINTAGAGGILKDWGLEICSSVNASPPFLVNNTPLVIPPMASSKIYKEWLLVDDNDNTASELTYTLVTVPEFGTLYNGSVPLEVGSTFKQTLINANLFGYTHDGGDEEFDNFRFTVNDPDGGFLGVLQYDIELDPNAVVSTEQLDATNSIYVFPNPAKDLINIQFKRPVVGKTQLSLTNVQGQQLLTQEFTNPAKTLEVNSSKLASGVYFISLQTGNEIMTQRVVIQR